MIRKNTFKKYNLVHKHVLKKKSIFYYLLLSSKGQISKKVSKVVQYL